MLRPAMPGALAERLERAQVLDRPAGALADSVVRALPPGKWTDALHGVPLGQPAHPALVRVPFGCWTSSVLLDLYGGPGAARASRVLTTAGLLASLPSAATGLADWSALHLHQRRVGLAHAVTQAGASVLFSASLLARLAGRPGAGRLLSVGGLALASAGAYLGGYLALRLGAGASHAEYVGYLAALGWQDLCPAAELPEGRPVRRQLGYLSLLAVRDGAAVYVLSDHCSHLGGPLHQGRTVSMQGTLCITCPWHGSTIRLSDGAVRHGPATATQPAFETRVTDSGWVQVRPLNSSRDQVGPRPRPGLSRPARAPR